PVQRPAPAVFSRRVGGILDCLMSDVLCCRRCKHKTSDNGHKTGRSTCGTYRTTITRRCEGTPSCKQKSVYGPAGSCATEIVVRPFAVARRTSRPATSRSEICAVPYPAGSTVIQWLAGTGQAARLLASSASGTAVTALCRAFHSWKNRLATVVSWITRVFSSFTVAAACVQLWLPV